MDPLPRSPPHEAAQPCKISQQGSRAAAKHARRQGTQGESSSPERPCSSGLSGACGAGSSRGTIR